jgi:hypothetical protein
MAYISNLQALGVSFVARYYTNLQRTRNPGKVLRPNEAHVLSQAGFSIVVVWELLDTPGYFSLDQGRDDGAYAYGYANEIIQQPENSSIYFSVDFDATQDQFRSSVVPYFQGVSQAFQEASQGAPIYSIGVYGSGAVCASLKQLGLARNSWVAQSRGWSGSAGYSDWQIQQGPLVSHPPFEFDQDLAQEDYGGFRLAFSGGPSSFV